MGGCGGRELTTGLSGAGLALLKYGFFGLADVCHARSGFRHMKGVVKRMDSSYTGEAFLHNERVVPRHEGIHEALFEQSPEGILVAAHGLIVKANQAFLTLFGHPAGSVLGKEPFVFFCLDDRLPARQWLANLATGEGLPVYQEFRGVRNDGSLFWAEVRGGLVELGEWRAIQLIVRDITGMREARESLRKFEARALESSENQIRTIIESSPVGILMSVNDRIVYANRAFVRMFGYHCIEEMTGMLVEDLYVPEDRPQINERRKAGSTERPTSESYEIRGLKKSGDSFAVAVWVTGIDLDGMPSTLLLAIDKSGEKALESQLYQARKMEAIGVLAGGIAHDFNNILAAILGCTELSLLKVPVGHPARQYLEQILKAGERAGKLVKQIIEFSRRKEEQRIAVQVDLVVEEALKLLRASFPANIEIRHTIKKGHGTVMGDPTQIHQVIMNLCTNAAYAMHENGGVLEVALDEIDLDESGARVYGRIESGQYARLTVTDTGHGIDAVVIGRIFEPYFTTKEKGEGTGMGLAVVHGIVKGLGGEIHVKSEVNKGTCFEILIPIVEDRDEEEVIHPNGIPRGHEHVLFVDDEIIILETMKAILLELGYDVDTRTSAVEALELLRKEPERYDLIVTDQGMPGMTGVQFAKALKKIRIDIPIVLCTGFSEVVSEEEAAALGIRGFLMKPVLIGNLAETIRSVLDA